MGPGRDRSAGGWRDRRPGGDRVEGGRPARRDDAARGARPYEDRPRRQDGDARPEWRDRRPQGERPARAGGYEGGRGRPEPRGAGGRPDRAGGRDWRDRRPTDDRRPRPDRDRTPPATPGPDLPDWADPRELDPSVRTALRGLDSRNAEKVAKHLVVAGTLVDEDPELALAHACAARDRASRLAVVREAVGVAAYHAGDYAEASRELRAYRRMSGEEGYRAVLADCERALGRPEVALRLVREALADRPDRQETVELQLVEAGARQDLGEVAAARLVLEGALGGRPAPGRVDLRDEGTLRLASAYADLLAASGDPSADAWREVVTAAEPEAEDIAFGEEEVPLAELAVDDEPEPAPTAQAAVSDGDEDADADDEDDSDGDAALGDDADDAEDAGDELDFESDVEREVAELLGEVDPPAGDQPGH